MNCNAPGPDGLVCADFAARHAHPHWQGFGPGAWVMWVEWSDSGVRYCGPVFETIGIFGAVLRELGNAARGAA